jgi:hypothetical protein
MLIIFISSYFLFFYGIYVFVYRTSTRIWGKLMTGTVINFIVSGSSFIPIIEFEYEDRVYRIRSYAAESAPPPAGSPVFIYFNPHNPKNVILKNNKADIYTPILLPAVALVMFFLSFI